MSPAKLVADLIGWNELVLLWFGPRARGTESDFPAPGYAWTQLGELAHQFYRDHAEEELLAVPPRTGWALGHGCSISAGFALRSVEQLLLDGQATSTR